MTGSLPPETLEQLLAGFALNDLDAEEAELFAQLLADDPTLRLEGDRLQETLELLPYALPEIEPPSHLREAILSATSPTNPIQPVSQPLRFPWSRVAAAIAALIALALGLDNYRLRQALYASQRETQQFAMLTYSLQSTKDTLDASAQVIVNPNNLEAELQIENLPPLPPGKVYVLWTVLKPNAPYTTDDKDAILTEVFEVDSQGNVSKSVLVPRAFRSQGVVSKVAITVEDAASPQKHEGSPILIAKQ
jgi:anti-sigma-K factor RskA